MAFDFAADGSRVATDVLYGSAEGLVAVVSGNAVSLVWGRLCAGHIAIFPVIGKLHLLGECKAT